MSYPLKLCQHESVEFILRKLPKFSQSIFSKKVDIVVTSFDVNEDVFIIGTKMGYLYYIKRETEEIYSFLLKKDSSICQIKVIQTINLSVAAGLDNGSVFILNMPIKNQINSNEINQFSLPVDHDGPITYMTWSKNSEKLFTGDNKGRIFCTEVDDMNRKVSSYHLLDTSSPITELCYHNKCLLISNEVDNFIYNLSTSSIVTLGSKPRNQRGQFGGCFIEKLFKPKEVEIAIIRPDLKVWISDLNGVIKKTFVLKYESLFSLEKSISLLPCVTSQSTTNYIGNIQSGISKYQLGLVTSINENEVLFWSNNGLIIFDLSTSKIVSSTCNLGTIISVSVCHVNYLIPPDNGVSSGTQIKSSSKLLEIWILRKPIRAEDSTLVRLSMLPLITSKSTINAYSDLSNYHQYHQNELISTVPEVCQSHPSLPESITISTEENSSLNVTGLVSDKWLPKFEINVVDTFQEITKKTKDIFKQSQDILEYTNDGVEQALELTEEGLIIEFDKNYDNFNTCNVVLDSSLKMENEGSTLNAIIMKSHIKRERKINFVDLDNLNLEDERPGIMAYQIENPWQDNSQNEADAISEIVTHDKDDLFHEDKYQNEAETGNCIVSEEVMWPSDDEESEISKSSNLIDEKLPIPKEVQNENICIDSNQQEYLFLNVNESEEIKVDPVIIHDSSVKTTEMLQYNCTGLIEESIMSIDLAVRSYSDSRIESLENSILDDYKRSNQISFYEDNFKDNSAEESLLSNYFEENTESIRVQDNLKLTDIILSSSNKWLTHRGPFLSGYNKIVSLSINRRMIWLIDTLGTIHVGFKSLENHYDSTEKSQFNWLQNNILQTDRIFSSPEGVILWREKCGEVSVYTGVTKIWTLKVVQEKVLLKNNWEQTMCKIKDIDIDNDMAVIVTTKGQLKVMNDISGRVTYKQSSTASITGHVTLVTTLNGIIWCVTEIIDPETKRAYQHIFACAAKDDDNKLNLSYWRTVPIPIDLISENEEHLGILGGTSQIKCLQLGNNNLSWIISYYNSCFFRTNISLDNPTGDGIWYQISLNFLFQVSTLNDEARFKKTSSNNIHSSVFIAVKATPKKSTGNGILWVTTAEKSCPSILFESNKDILGHGWADCFSSKLKRNSITSLPPILTWTSVTFGFKNVLWLINNSNEIYCYWKDTRIRNIAISSSFGKVIQISAYGCIVVVLTITNFVLLRIGITSNNPIGSGWLTVSNTNKDEKEIKPIKFISCFENELWILTNENTFYLDDIRSYISNITKKNNWKLFEFKLTDSFHSNSFSSIQVATEYLGKKYIWSISDPDGYVYLGIWDISTNTFNWSYIPGPKAKSIHISDENVWIVDQISGEIYVRCGIHFEHKATGDYWIHIPLITIPVKSLSVSSNNNVVVIDSKERLLSHTWTIVKGNATENISNIIPQNKSLEGDWELLN